MEAGRGSLSALSEELLFHLLEFFSPGERLSLALLNKAFHRLACDEGWWRKQCLNHPTCHDYRGIGLIEKEKPQTCTWRHWYFKLFGMTIGWFQRVSAMYDFEGEEEEDGELSFKSLDELIVLETDSSGWWLCEHPQTKKQGMVPSEYVQSVATNLYALVTRPEKKKAAPQQEDLSRTGGAVITIDGVLSRNECDAIISKTERCGYAPNFERVDIAPLKDRALAGRIWTRVQDHVPALQDEWQVVGINEEFRALRYIPGHTPVEHTDGAFKRTDTNQKSLLSLVIYLNDDFEGGGTEFSLDHSMQKLCVNPKQGMAVIFAHGIKHEGVEVAMHTKYALRTDVVYQHIG